MEQSNDQSLRLAVLIDADNASRTAMRDVMAEIAVYGTPTIKRIYGDWTMGVPYTAASAMISRRAERGALSASMSTASRRS